MKVSGWSEAEQWLEENAPEWVLAESEVMSQETVAGPITVGYRVVLRRRDKVARGEGSTIRQAAEAAVGGIVDSE